MAQKQTGHIQPVVVVLNATFPWLSPCKSLKNYWISPRDIDDQRLLKSDWMRGSTGWLHPAKKVLVSDTTFLPTFIFMKKIYDIDWFLPELLMIKEFCHLISHEVQLAGYIQPKVVVADVTFLWWHGVLTLVTFPTSGLYFHLGWTPLPCRNSIHKRSQGILVHDLWKVRTVRLLTSAWALDLQKIFFNKLNTLSLYQINFTNKNFV